MPRSFKLLEEMDKVKKGNVPHWSIGMNLKVADDIDLKEFELQVTGPLDSIVQENTYKFQVIPGKDYPESAPSIRLLRPKVNLKCVNSQGVLSFKWNSQMSICQVGDFFRQELERAVRGKKKGSQPSADTSY